MIPHLFKQLINYTNMESKKCFKCKIDKLYSQYYKHKGMGDGYLGKCKDCAKNDSKKLYRENMLDFSFKEKERKRGRLRYNNVEYKKQKHIYDIKNKKNAIDRYKTKYPEKKKSGGYTTGLIRTQINSEFHHWSYNKEHYKDVIELHIKHHKKIHRFLIYDQERFMYRRFDTNELLNTKEKHEEFIAYVLENFED